MSTLAPKPIKHLLLDLDGTLVRFKELPTQLSFIYRTLRYLGGRHHRFDRVLRAIRAMNTELLRSAGPSKESEWSGLVNTERSARAFSRAIGLGIEEGTALLRETLAEVFPRLEGRFSPMPGAKEFIERMRGKYPLVLATNPVWPVELIHFRLAWAGISPDVFSLITHGDLMHACKPHIDYYKEVLKLIGFEKNPDECLLVGNDVVNDLAAMKAGIQVFLVSKKKNFLDVAKFLEGEK